MKFKKTISLCSLVLCLSICLFSKQAHASLLRSIEDSLRRYFSPAEENSSRSSQLKSFSHSKTSERIDNLKAEGLSGGKDRDGEVVLKWSSLKLNGKDAKQYRVSIFSTAVLAVQGNTNLDPYMVLPPLYIKAQNGSHQEIFLNLLGLIGPKGEGAIKSYKSFLKDLANGHRTVLVFKVQGTDDKITGGEADYEPVLDESGRQVGNQVKKIEKYNYNGKAYSNSCAVTFDIEDKPAALKLRMLERYPSDNNGSFLYRDKQELKELIEVDIGSHREVINHNPDVDHVYSDGDGVLDMRWEEADGHIPNYPMYQVQVSKWPVFTRNDNHDLSDQEDYYLNQTIYTRYFGEQESIAFLYQGLEDYLQAPQGGYASLKDGSAWRAPFFTRNLAIECYVTQNGHQFPVYFNGNEYGVIDTVQDQPSLFYVRVRAIGRDGHSLRYGNGGYVDEPRGEWSQIAVVRIDQNSRLPQCSFQESPQEIDDQRENGTKLLPNGQAPLNWNLVTDSGMLNPADDAQRTQVPIYQVLMSNNPNLVTDDGAAINWDQKDPQVSPSTVTADYYFLSKDDNPYSGLGSGSVQDPHHIITLWDEEGHLRQGQQYIWVRTLSNEPDSIPGLWSAQTDLNVQPFEHVTQPQLLSPSDNQDLDNVTLHLNWCFKTEGDALAEYFDDHDPHFVPFYRVLVYREQTINDAGGAPTDANGFLLYQDSNTNTVNDWEETEKSGGKAFASYRITHEELQHFQETHDDMKYLFDIDLTYIYDLTVHTDEKLSFEQHQQKVPKGNYYVFIEAFDQTGTVSPLSSGHCFHVVRGTDITAPHLTRPSLAESPNVSNVILNWYFETEGDAQSSQFADFEGEKYVPYYQILIYRKSTLQGDGDTLNLPVDEAGHLLEIDQNDNEVNDWQETEKTGGLAYAIYGVPAAHLITATDQMHTVDLTRVYNIAQDELGQLKKDESGNFIYEQETRSAEVGDYVFMLQAYDRMGKPIELSNEATAHIAQGNVFPLAPQWSPPQQILWNNSHSYSLDHMLVDYPEHSPQIETDPVLKGCMPLNWFFEAPGDTLDHSYPSYEVIVYKQDPSHPDFTPLDSQGLLAYEDADGDAVNDYEQIHWQEDDAGKAHAVFYFNSDHLGTGSLNDPFQRLNLFVREYQLLTDGSSDYVPAYSALEAGVYQIYMFAYSETGLAGFVSAEPLVVEIAENHELPPAPTLYDPLDSAQQNHSAAELQDMLQEGLVSITWTIDHPNDYPVYELIVSRTPQDLTENHPIDIYSRTFLQTSSLDMDHQPYYLKNLMIRHYQESAEGFQPVYEDVLNQGTYYFWIRAFSHAHNGHPGPWSSPVQVDIDFDLNPLAAPQMSVPGTSQTGLIPIQWQPVNPQNVYELQVARKPFNAEDFSSTDLLPEDFISHQMFWNSDANQPNDVMFYKNLSIVGYNSTIDANGNTVYDYSQPVYAIPGDPYSATDGSYYFRIRAIADLDASLKNKAEFFERQSDWSPVQSLSLTMAKKPQAVYLKSITPGTDHNGVIAMRWQFTRVQQQDVPTTVEEDGLDANNLDQYPVYEVQVSQANPVFSTQTTAYSFAGSQYLTDPSTGLQYEGYPYIQDLKLIDSLPTDASATIAFQNNTTYYFRVRALSSTGWPRIPGPWSNTQYARVEVASSPSPPILAIDPETEMNGTIVGNSGQLYWNDLVSHRYYELSLDPASDSMTNSCFYELWEGDGVLPNTSLEAMMVHYLNASSAVDRHVSLRRSPDGSYLDNPDVDVLPQDEHTYFYKARVWSSEPFYDSPDHLGDAVVSDWSHSVAIQISSSGAVVQSKDRDQANWRV